MRVRVRVRVRVQFRIRVRLRLWVRVLVRVMTNSGQILCFGALHPGLMASSHACRLLSPEAAEERPSDDSAHVHPPPVRSSPEAREFAVGCPPLAPPRTESAGL